jgi:hypothetical protein
MREQPASMPGTQIPLRAKVCTEAFPIKASGYPEVIQKRAWGRSRVISSKGTSKEEYFPD